MRDDGPAAELVQDLSQTRFHTRAEAGSENKNIQRRHCRSWLFAHSSSLVLAGGELGLYARQSSRTCSLGTRNNDAGQTFRVVAHHLALIEQVGAHDLSLRIQNTDLRFVKAHLKCAVGSIRLSLLNANRPVIEHGIVEMDLRRVLLNCFQMLTYVVPISFTGLCHQVCDEYPGGARFANGVGHPSYDQVWNYTGIQRAWSDSDDVRGANRSDCGRQ